jgi:hypothetical protein
MLAHADTAPFDDTNIVDCSLPIELGGVVVRRREGPPMSHLGFRWATG